MIGQTISQYKILEKLGEGGMGVVYKAEDTKLDRLVALKFLPPHMAASDQDKARFIQEAKAASALNHPNVCTIHDIQEHDGRMFIVMEFVDGQTLRQKLGTTNFKQAADIGIQVADGLAAAHEKGIVHRDIKPENIMVRKDGIVQIMDFGLAKLRSSGSKVNRLTKEGSTVGTAGYMSPEQIQGLEADHRSDIFSLGVLLYEMFTGELPFKGVHETALAYEIVNVDPAPMSAVRPEIDPTLDTIVLECLEKEPRERTQSAAQVSLDLKRHRRESSKQKMSRITASRPVMHSGSRQPVGSGPRAQAELPAPQRNVSWLAWSVAAVCALALAALAVIHFREVAPDLPSINAALLPPAGYTYFSDDGGHLALSPDGTMLAFVATDSSGKNGLWLRPLNTPSARQLSETEGASYPFWSPDNKFVGYFASGKLRKASIAGGPSVEICDAPNGRGGTWNRDGVILFAPNSDFIGIHRVSATGGKSVPVTAVDTSQNQSNHRWPKFLPDGKHFLYATQARVRTSDFLGAIYVSSLDSSVNKLLIKASSNVDYGGGAILYVRQKSVVAQPFNLSTLDIAGDPTPAAERIEFSGDKSHGSFSISENGVLTYQITGNNSKLLAMYDRSGKKTKEVGDRTVQYFARLSPDGTKVAFDSRDQSVGTADIWIYDVIRNISTRFTFDQSIEWSPIWSPTGDRIGYSSDRQGSGDLYVKSSNGTEAEQLLLKSVPQKQPSDWSPDGQTILFNDYDPTTRADLWVMPQEGKQEPFPFLRTEFVEENARFSPDGHWVVYRSDESGKGEIYVRPFPSGSGKWQVSVKGGDLPVWRRDGKEIFYQMGGAVMAVDVDGTGSAFTVGSAKQLFELPRSLLYDVSVDGTQVLMGVVSGEQGAPPVTLVTNWDKEMKRK